MASINKKYVGLPDLDVEPDFYGTPGLSDDESTVQTGTLRTISSIPSSPAHDSDDGNIDRTRFNRGQARERFRGSRLNAEGVDFSDSVAGNRKSYAALRRRVRRRLRVGDDEESDESIVEDETPAEKLARLRREAEELKEELKRENEARTNGDVKEERVKGITEKGEQDYNIEDGLSQLSRMLDNLHSGRSGIDAETYLTQQLADGPPKAPPSPSQGPPPVAQSRPVQIQGPEAPSPESLNAIAEFSSRLTTIEDALGIQSSTTIFSDTQPPAILPALTTLSSQLTALSTTLSTPPSTSATTTLPSLETLTTRLRSLTTESAALLKSREAATEAARKLTEARTQAIITGNQASLSTPNPQSPSWAPDLQHVDQSDKIAALHQQLPTIEKLAPLLPLVLERLKGLRQVHAGAAEARSELDEVRKGQARCEGEVKKWKEVLEMVEGKMEEGEGVMKENVETIGGWVRELEARVGKLGR